MRSAVLVITVSALTLGACAQVQKFRTRADMVAAPVCTDFTFPIYFETGSAQLTQAASAAIEASRGQVGACKVASVRVTGLADAQGDAATNLELSKRRATVVGQALAARGYPTPEFDMRAAGEAGAATAAGVTPLRRRTDVSVKFATATPSR